MREMMVRCPRCSAAREVETESADGRCVECGYTATAMVLTAPATKLEAAPRERMASIASGYSKTRDLFRMAGGQSIPVEARVSPEPKPAPAAPVAPAPEPPASASGRKPEASIMFSLEELMKSASGGNSKPEESSDEQQLWSMQAQTPIFGTSNDQALLTTPLEPAPGSASLDSMTVSSRRPNGLRLAPLLIGVVGGCTLILAGAGWWMFRDSAAASPVAQEIDVPGPEQPSASAPAAPPTTAPAAAAQPTAVAPAANDAPAAGAEAAAEEPSEPSSNPALAAAAVSPSDKPAAASRAPSSAKKHTPPRAKPMAAQFDKAAAKDALNSAANKASACGAGGGAKGKVQLTFASSGKVSSAQITEGPFAGTAAGKCALRHFKAARIPPFSGPPQTVAKSFKIP